MRRQFGVALGIAAMLLSACNGKPDGKDGAPPRATSVAPAPEVTSMIAVPITTDNAALQRAIEGAIPKTLWTINKREPRCIAPQKVDVLGVKLGETPAIACTITGKVTRGSLRLRGQGDEIIVDVPLNAAISARDVGGVLKGETATGSALASVHIKLELLPDWQTRGKADIRYSWTKEPGIDFLGQRITFTDQANARLAPVIGDVEREVAREIARLNVRAQAESVWRQAFATIELNRENPPVWMRVTPQRVLYGGYAMEGRQLRLNLAVEALTETMVGDKPSAREPTPLPQLVRDSPEPRLNLFVPVLAQYDQLEPVVLRALERRSARPFALPGMGNVMVKFNAVTAYGTGEGRIAVGLDIEAQPSEITDEITKGRIWITAIPDNDEGSATIRFRDVQVTGDTDGMGGDLLIAIGQSGAVSELLASELTQNLGQDLAELQGKIRTAVNNAREGDFVIQARVDRFETGRIQAFGNGLYLPVRMIGQAKVKFKPIADMGR